MLNALLLALMLVAFEARLIGFTAPATDTPLGSAYTCHGTSQGQPYTLKLAITPHGENYRVVWTSEGVMLHAGFGIRDGEHMAVVFATQEGHIGVILFSITAGTLRGVWSGGDGTVQTEVCRMGEEV